MDTDEVTARLLSTESRSKSNSYRIKELEDVVKNVYSQNVNISTMLLQIQQMQEVLKGHTESIKELEHRPRKWVDIVFQAVLTAVVASFIVFLFPHIR